MGYKTIEKGYYWVKFYNHERKMILFYTGVFWEQFKHDDRIHDEIESYERVAKPSSVPQANELLPHVSGSTLAGAFDVCFTMREWCGNVIAGADEEDDITRDKEMLDKCNAFIGWFKEYYR